MGLGVLPWPAPALAFHGLLSRVVGRLVESVVVPAHGSVGCVPGLASCALAPLSVRCLVDAGALAGALHTPPLPACGLGVPYRGVRTATSHVGFAHALGVTVRCLDECARALLAVARPGMTVCGHTGPATGHGTGPFSPLTIRGRRRGVGSQGKVTGIARRLLLPPGIAATLG